MKDGLWRGTVKAPEVSIAKQRYWAIYDPNFHEFIITGKEKNSVYDIDALQTPKSPEEELILGYRRGWNTPFK
jgi:hypothetical protein